MQTETVLCSIDDHIATVTMNRPPVNAQNAQFHVDMALVFDWLSDHDDARAVVLTGSGKCFSAGADIKEQAGKERGPGDAWQHNRRVRGCFYSIMECQKPVIGAVNGPALGAGLAVAASCDILVASSNTVLALPEINVGLLGGGRHAMRLFSHSRLRRMLLTGYQVSGPELYRLGVVEACVEPETLMDTAMEIAREIVARSPIAIRLAKQSLNAIEDMSLRDGYRYEQNMTVELSKTEDSKEAKRAFVEKRQPVFTGR